MLRRARRAAPATPARSAMPLASVGFGADAPPVSASVSATSSGRPRFSSAHASAFSAKARSDAVPSARSRSVRRAAIPASASPTDAVRSASITSRAITSGRDRTPARSDVARIAALSADGGDPLGPEEIDAALERLDAVDDFQLLAVPGQSSPGVVARFQSYCLRRRAFYLVDCDERASFATLGNGPDPAITGPSAINSALYFRWVVAPDPLQENRLRPDPPSGFVAGIYARTDALRGVWNAPAGADAILTRSAGVSRPLTDLESGALNERGVNCIRRFPLRAGALIWGVVLSTVPRSATPSGSTFPYGASLSSSRRAWFAAPGGSSSSPTPSRRGRASRMRREPS